MKNFGINNAFGRACLLSFSLTLYSMGAEVKPLESCAAVDRLWMGMEEGVIRPAAYEQIRASIAGFIILHAKDGQMLQKDEHWATLDPDQLEIERESLALEEMKLKRQLMKDRHEAIDARARMNLELHETEAKRVALLDAAEEPELPVALKRRAGEAVARIDEQITLLRERLDPAKMESDLQLDADEGRLQIVRKRQQLELMERRSRQLSGFPGELRISDSLNKALGAAESPDSMIWLKPNELIATIVDDRHYEISVSAAGPLLAEIPQDQLLVFLQDSQTGKLIPGEYARTDEIDNGREISRNFVFTIRENGVEGARQAQGTRSLIHVYRKFTRPYRLVYKKDIAFSAPDVLESAGWDGLVRHLWPGSKVIQVGPQTIAVEPKDAN